jgi:hypothetical protein
VIEKEPTSQAIRDALPPLLVTVGQNRRVRSSELMAALAHIEKQTLFQSKWHHRRPTRALVFRATKEAVVSDTTTHAFVLPAAAASERAFGYTRACSPPAMTAAPRR